MYFKNSVSAANAVFVFILILAGIACTNPGSTEEHEQEPFGIIIYEGQDIRVQQDVGGELTGALSVPETEDRIFSVTFLDEEGDPYTPEAGEHSLDFGFSEGESLVTVSQEDGLDQTYIFTLSGVSTGTASMRIHLKHEGADEFVSNYFPVEITPAQ